MIGGTSRKPSGEVLLGRSLHDVTQLLESADGAGERVLRVLALLRDLVPYDQCALLDARFGDQPDVLLVPEAAPSERVLLTSTLVDFFGQLVDAPPLRRAPVSRPRDRHLAVPLVGLDEVIGLLLVRSSTREYTEDDLRVLSVIAAKLAAYLTMLRARAHLTALARERDEARRAAEGANRAKDEFLALVSHELKTPLTSILAWTHILRSTIDDAGAHARAIDALEGNVQTQSRLIDDILALACVASAELRLNLRVIEPAGLIKATLDRLRVEADRKSIHLEADLDAAAMPLVLDPERIGQVISILVGHAIHFTPEGGQVAVRLDRATGYARIQVSDSGQGISPEALPHVFDRFRQSLPARARGQAGRGDGLGVDLAIVKDLVELHGGRVRAQSASPEGGATFTVDLPRMPGARAAAPALAGPSSGALLGGVRVLLVDDDLGLRESLASVLDQYGAIVTAVASAPEALAAIDRARPDVLLFGDLATRGQDIYDLMREVTTRTCPLPAASISSWRHEERARERAAGFRLHLNKPIEIGTLVDAVAYLAGRMGEGPARTTSVGGEDGRR